ncbi:MAG: sigma-54 dependent transcriptional regulator, partial [Myxococcota bacterium]
NGEPIAEHILNEGDVITVGKTQLAFMPDGDGVALMRPSSAGRVTIEVGSRELLAAGTPGIDGRAWRHLAAVAQLGDGMRAVDSREELGKSACEAALSGLSAQRSFLLLRDAAGRMNPVAAARSAKAGGGAGLSLPHEVIEKVLAEGKAITLDTAGGPAVAAPVFGALAGSANEVPIGLLYADRTVGASWDRVGLLAASCMAHLISAALAGFEARSALQRENNALAERLGTSQFIGSSPAARAILDFVHKVGPSDATVLLTGESGSGKEMVAQAVHRASRRSRQPFIAINCAALTESLIESELFGHEKGAVTGATERKLGRFELADKGTLFLDEVGELPLACQTKFLRVLEERVFERVGGGQTIAVDVRVVAATNRNLPDMVRRGRFRDDLYYRLSVIHTTVPPLRQRSEDIAELAQHFLVRLRSQVPRRITGFADDAVAALTAHAWPGNVRELKNAVERAIVLGDGELLSARDLPPYITHTGPMPGTPPAPDPHARMIAPVVVPPMGHMPPVAPALPHAPPTDAPVAPVMPSAMPPVVTPATAVTPATPTPAVAAPRSLRELEREGIIAALRATGGNKAQAATILKIDRSTLYKKIKDYGIT